MLEAAHIAYENTKRTNQDSLSMLLPGVPGEATYSHADTDFKNIEAVPWEMSITIKATKVAGREGEFDSRKYEVTVNRLDLYKAKLLTFVRTAIHSTGVREYYLPFAIALLPVAGIFLFIGGE